MAVLEKIRKRSVLLFIIIIGALLAFILGDFLNSGRSLFGPGDTMVQVGNVKVKQMDFNRQSEKLENNVKMAKAYGQDMPAEMNDPGYRYNQALEYAMYEKLMNRECERLGIEVTDDFLSKIVADPNMGGYVWQTLIGQFGDNGQQTMAYLQQNGIVDPVSYLDAIKNPARYHLSDISGLAQAWSLMEEEMSRQIEYNLYGQMLSAMMQTNKADAKAFFDNQNTMAAVKAVSVPVSTVSDDEITIEPADYQALYNKTKDGFRILDENREVAFVIVPIVPSDEDYATAEKMSADLVAALADADPAQVMGNFKGFSHETKKLTKEQMDRNYLYAALRNDSTGLHKGQVKELLSGRNKKTVAKVLDITEGIDKVKYTFYPVSGENQADSLFADKSAAAVDSVISSLSGGQLADMTTSLVNPDRNGYAGYFTGIPAVEQALKTAPLNQYIFVNDTTQEGVYGVLVVKERDAAVPVYEIAEMAYEVYPSEKTRQDLTQQLHSYVANHPTANAFANDTTGTYRLMYSLVNPASYTLSSPQLTPGTRGVVKWVMDVAKKGSVSPVYPLSRTISGRNGQPDKNEDYLLAVAVLDVYDNYVPYTSQLVQDGLRGQVTADKKAAVLIDKYAGKGKTLNDYASVMSATPQNMNVAFGAGTIGGEAQGAVAAAKKGDLVGPVKGLNAVYVFEIEDVTAADKFDSVDLQTRLNESRMRRPEIGLPMLVGNRKVKNNTLHFTATPDAE